MARQSDPHPAAFAGSHDVDTGITEIEGLRDDPDGWLVTVNGVPSSYVDLADPTRLEFEYVRWIGDLLDVLAPPGEPLAVLHLGGAGCTLPRYVTATRPGSRQLVLEHDAALVDLARQAFGLRRRGAGFRIRAADALEGIRTLPPGGYDVVVRDTFLGEDIPPHLATPEFVGEVARVLRTGGVYVANVADKPGLRLVRAEARTALESFRRVLLVGETAHLRGRRFGNVVLVASSGTLPVPELTRRVAGGPVPSRVLDPAQVRELLGG